MLMRTEDKNMSNESKKAYTKPELVSRGNILELTKGSGLLPNDNNATAIEPGQAS